MRVLLISHYFPPEIGSGPHLPYELAETLVRHGHEVTVVTGFPRYNVPVMPPRYRRKLWAREEMGGVAVLRVNSPNYYGSSVLSRGLVQILAPPVLALRAAATARPDVVYTITPPIIMGWAARVAARRHRVPWAVNVQDLFPQCMIDLGILRGRRMIGFFERLERNLYRSAPAIVVMSEGNRDFVVARGADSDRVHVVPNWVDTDAIEARERTGRFRAEYGLGDAFLVVFAGTMGFSQGLDIVVDAARLTQGTEGLLWVMVGGGAERDRLFAASSGLPNIRFVPMQPKDKYPDVLADADVCLVTLRPEVATPTVPSKIGTIMAAGRPMVAAIPYVGDAPRVIEESGGGLVVPPSDPARLAEAVKLLRADPTRLHSMGRAGRAYAERHLSREQCAAKVETVLAELIGKSRVES